ncbi:ArsR family transcriptional regulator [Pseudarthrobacter sulfonivorans]|uniref:ArsR family transcriptional regulator n=1 Tax=Pseudarthrobacter sulfonivorans TaxID=121292 RepID=UPI003D33AC6F
MNRTRSRLLHFLSKRGPSTSQQISEGIGLSPSAVRKQLSALVSSGCVEVSQNSVRKGAVFYFANAGQIQERSEAARLILDIVE